MASTYLYKTKYGKFYTGEIETILKSRSFQSIKGKVQLIFTSPPFPLNEEKRYGNRKGDEYRKWFISLADKFSELLIDNGSIVIELGNAWEPGRPIQSLLPLDSLLGFVNEPAAGLRLCQNFICFNPARLPSPAQWVTVNRIRTNDSYTNIWWMAKTDYPKADNKKVLRPYSDSMKLLLRKNKYNYGARPSQHNLSKKGFLKNNSGSIMPNVIEIESINGENKRRLPNNILKIANTSSSNYFIKECKRRGIIPHPARMPFELACFFIEFLTDPGDLVLDPFAGSNTTGYCSELLKRKWIGIELNPDYGTQSRIRFNDPIFQRRNL